MSQATGVHLAIPSRKRRTLMGREARWALFFLAPNIIGFILFTAGPFLASFAFGFLDWDLVTPPRFVGLDNYLRMLRDSVFWQVLFNTVYYTVAVVPISLVLGLALAVPLNQGIPGNMLYQTIYFIPYVIPMVAAALVWQSLYISDFGLINYYLSRLGLPAPDWLNSTIWAMPAIIIMSVWKRLGFVVVVLLAGLKSIPKTYYEAATIDGASSWQQFKALTLPLLSPTMFFIIVISIIDSFQVFDQTYIMTQGGPADATRTLVQYIYENGFQFFRMGYASSLAWILFLVIFGFTLWQFQMQKKWVHYD